MGMSKQIVATKSIVKRFTLISFDKKLYNLYMIKINFKYI